MSWRPPWKRGIETAAPGYHLLELVSDISVQANAPETSRRSSLGRGRIFPSRASTLWNRVIGLVRPILIFPQGAVETSDATVETGDG